MFLPELSRSTPAARHAIVVCAVVAAVALFGVRAPSWGRTSPRAIGSATQTAALRLRLEPPAPADIEPVASLPSDLQDRIDLLVTRAMRQHKLPGAVVVVGRRDGVLFRRAYGNRSVTPSAVAMTADTVFDLASLTKPIATATEIMQLWEQGRLELDAPVGRIIPAFDTDDKRGITARMLLTHTSGLPAGTDVHDYGSGVDHALSAIARARLLDEPGTKYRYSDLGFIALGEVVRALTGRSMAENASEGVFAPLGMRETGYCPSDALRGRTAPTAMRDGRLLVGEVHDPRAAALQGVAGHAGLFSTADDLSRFARMLLGRGQLDGVRVLTPQAIDEMLRPQGDPSHPRALGWDVPGPSAGYAHGGFTGTYLWFDPSRDLFLVFLSSRLHPDGKGRVLELTAAIRGALLQAWESSSLAPATSSGNVVLAGIDVLRREQFARLRGAHVAIVANAASRARDGTRTIDLLARAANVDLVSILTPEHGIDSMREAAVADGIDEATGVPIRSLYGSRYRPTAEDLRGADTIVFDLQDAGARFYTYLGTLRFCLEAAAASNRRFVVLDRPNPGGGDDIEGPAPHPLSNTLLQPLDVPVRHGMTFGELARLAASDLRLAVSPEVVEMQGWERWMRYADTGLAWTPPSPNLRDADAALLYPGLAWFETTNVSVGRGTSEPFHLVGAPWMDGRLAESVAAAGVPGVSIDGAEFTPRTSEHGGVRCRGIRVSVKDRRAIRPLRLAWAIAAAVDELYPGRWRRAGFTTLAGSDRLARAWELGPGREVASEVEVDEAAFEQRRRAFLIYPSQSLQVAAERRLQTSGSRLQGAAIE